MSDERASIARPLTPIIGARLAGNLLIRFPFVFVKSIAAGLGISVTSLTSLLGIRELGGLASPAIGQMADRGHERRVMVITATAAGLSTLAVAWRPSSWPLIALLLVGGIAKFGSDTAQTAWIGHRVPFQRRGRIFGLTELSWALAFLLGIPICAWLESRWGWRALFVFCGALLLVMGVATRAVVPSDAPETVTSRGRPRLSAPLIGVYAYVFFQPFAQMFVFAVQGQWFVDRLHMSTAQLGVSGVLIGFGELVGTGLTAVITDRVGKRRSAIAGVAVAAPMALGLLLVGSSQWLGVTLLVVMAGGLEFSFVSALPIITELDPDARAAAVGIATVVIVVARGTSSAIAAHAYAAGGIAATGVVGAISFALAAAALWRVVEPSALPAHGEP